MKVYPVPEDEDLRLMDLASYEVIGRSDPRLDEIAQMAKDFLGADMGLVTFVDRRTQWLVGRAGIDVESTPREHAFCNVAIMQPDQPLVVTDATEDPRFRDNPLVTGPLGIRFYAAQVIRSDRGHAMGALCIVGHEPGVVTSGQLVLLARMRDAVEDYLNERRERRLQDALGQGD